MLLFLLKSASITIIYSTYRVICVQETPCNIKRNPLYEWVLSVIFLRIVSFYPFQKYD